MQASLAKSLLMLIVWTGTGQLNLISGAPLFDFIKIFDLLLGSEKQSIQLNIFREFKSIVIRICRVKSVVGFQLDKLTTPQRHLTQYVAVSQDIHEYISELGIFLNFFSMFMISVTMSYV